MEKLIKKKGPRSPFKKEPPEEKLVKGKGTQPPFEGEIFEKLLEASIEIKMIKAAPFFHAFKQNKVKLFSVFFLKNVEKPLRFEQRTNSVTILFPKFH